jgi:chromosome partitioning protein
MINIGIANLKGGVGKTTIAISLAAILKEANLNVSLDDRDLVQETSKFLAPRFDLNLGREGEYVISDLAPNLDRPETLETFATADLIVLIATPILGDYHSTLKTIPVLKSTRPDKPVMLLFNKVGKNTKLGKNVEKYKDDLGYPALKNVIALRPCYGNMQSEGIKALTQDARMELFKVGMEIINAAKNSTQRVVQAA